jgi:hypothetical protein
MGTIRTFTTAVRNAMVKVEVLLERVRLRRMMRRSDKIVRKLDRRLAKALGHPRAMHYQWELHALNPALEVTWQKFMLHFELGIIAVTTFDDITIAATALRPMFRQHFRFWVSPELSQPLHPRLRRELQKEYLEAYQAFEKKQEEKWTCTTFSTCTWSGRPFETLKQFDRLVLEEQVNAALEEAP